MRLIAFIVAALAVSGPALAQEWQEYSSTKDAFVVMFPGAPKVETTTYEVVAGRSVPARIYSVRQDKSELKITVADLDNTGLQEKEVIDYAIKRLSEDGEVKLNYPHRIYEVYGRQLSIQGKDGSRSTVAVFDIYGRLYQIEARVFPGGNDLDLIRFQQSLDFDRGISNRTLEQVRAFVAACAGSPTAPPFPPGGFDDPRCVRP